MALRELPDVEHCYSLFEIMKIFFSLQTVLMDFISSSSSFACQSHNARQLETIKLQFPSFSTHLDEA